LHTSAAVATLGIKDSMIGLYGLSSKTLC